MQKSSLIEESIARKSYVRMKKTVLSWNRSVDINKKYNHQEFHQKMPDVILSNYERNYMVYKSHENYYFFAYHNPHLLELRPT